jgi:hypothetical protein
MANEKLKKDTNHQVLIKSQQKWLKQEAWQFVLRSINLLILFGIRRNCPSSTWGSITVPIYKADKWDWSNYNGTSLLSLTFKMLSNILLSRLTPYADEIIRDHQCGLRHNSITDHIFCTCQILDKRVRQYSYL